MESNRYDRLAVSNIRRHISPEAISVLGTVQNTMFTGYVLSSLKNVLEMNNKRDTV